MDIVDVERLRQLARAAADGQWREFSMRVPAEPDRDADLVLARAADEIERLRKELHDYQHASAVANDCIATLRAENAELRADAERYRWLRDRLLAADFDYGDEHESVIVFRWPKNSSISANLDASIDAAKEQK